PTLGARRIEERHLDAERGEILDEQALGAAVHAALREDVSAAGRERQQRRRHRRHAAGEHERVLSSLERGELVREDAMVWEVAEARIAYVVIARARVLLEHGRTKDREHRGALDAGSLLTSVQQLCVGAHFV